MVFIYTLIMSTASILLINHDQSEYIYLATILLTLLHYSRLYMDDNSSFASKLKNGEFFHQFSYLFWLVYFSKDEYMFYAPLVLSNVGKIYSIFHGKDDDNQTMIEELIKFQAKMEFYLAFILLMKLMNPTSSKFL